MLMTITGRSLHRMVILKLIFWSQLSHVGFHCLSLATAAEIPTVTAVQGDRFHGLDVASIFLTGCKYECQKLKPQIDCSCRQTTYHVPDSWLDKRQIHLENQTTDFSCFYRDKRTEGANGMPGEDESVAHGLEQSQITFYAGHGDPEGFRAIESKTVALGDFSLGDINTRYLFMTSCNVFAHGPRLKGGDFINPDLFDASQFRAEQSLTGSAPGMANVFFNWGRNYGNARYPLNPSLRLACGGSSLIGGAVEFGDYPTHLFWYYSSVRRLNPADSWLVSLYIRGKAEPLCMSRGDSLKASGLSDPEFEMTPPAAPGTLPKFVYIQYPVEGRADDPLIQAASTGVVGNLGAPHTGLNEASIYPILQVAPTTLPAIFKDSPQGGSHLGYGFLGGAASAVANGLLPTLFPPSPAAENSVIKPEDVCIERNPASGSAAISWRPIALGENPNIERELDIAANDFLLRLLTIFKDNEQQSASQNEQKASVLEVIAIQLRADELEAATLLAQPKPQDGCLYLRQTRGIDIGQGKSVPILGEGSETFIGRCPAAVLRSGSPAVPQAQANPCERAGSPLATFVYTNRVIKTDLDHARREVLRPKDTVIQEARSRLGLSADQADRYTSVTLRLGYRAAPAHCVQGQMYLVYEVDFTSDDSSLLPRTIEVPAQDLPEARTIEKTWECSPE
jgi:hypothetical protein